MISILFNIRYKLTLLDGSYMSTSSYVVAENSEIAMFKLKIWRKQLKPKFKNIEYLACDEFDYEVIV